MVAWEKREYRKRLRRVLSEKEHAWSEIKVKVAKGHCSRARYQTEDNRIMSEKKITFDQITGILNADLLHDEQTAANTQAEHGWLWKHQRNISRKSSRGSRLMGER